MSLFKFANITTIVLVLIAFSTWIKIITEEKIVVHEDGHSDQDIFNITYAQGNRLDFYIAV